MPPHHEDRPDVPTAATSPDHQQTARQLRDAARLITGTDPHSRTDHDRLTTVADALDDGIYIPTDVAEARCTAHHYLNPTI